MGSDKAHRSFAGQPAATRLACLLDGLFEDLLLVGGDPPGDAPGRRVPDPSGAPCALRGILGALGEARQPRVLVVATDLPLLHEELILALVAWPCAEVVLPRAGGFPQPLCALYQRDAALRAARAQWESGDLAVTAFLARLTPHFLEGEDLASCDPGGLALENANTPAAWRRLERARGEGGLCGAPQRGRGPLPR